MNQQFSEAQIAQWADQVSDELNEVMRHETFSVKTHKGEGDTNVPLVPEALRARIETATGESAESFWEKIKIAVHKDLCVEGGHLNSEWKRYKDLPTKDVVTWTITFLSAIGLAVGSSAGLAIVPIAVWILHVVLNIGISAICEVNPSATPQTPAVQA